MSGVGHVLIVGGTASMAEKLINLASEAGFAITATTRRQPRAARKLDVLWKELNLADAHAVRRFDVGGISHAILLAGVTSIGQCESDPVAAYRVNVHGLGLLASKLFESGTRVLALSTSQVFSRYVDAPLPLDERSPTCEYGRQKALLEDQILDNQLGAVVRLTKIVPPELPLISGWFHSLSRGERIKAFRNVAVAPIDLNFASENVWEILRNQSSASVHHLSSSDQMSYADFIEAVRVQAGLPGFVESVSVSQSLTDGIVVGPYARLGASDPGAHFLNSSALIANLARDLARCNEELSTTNHD